MEPVRPDLTTTNVVPTGACHDCGGRCVLKVHVSNGVAIKIETDDGEEPQLRACARGRAYRRQVYSPDRLLHPLRRTGPRGSGQFEQISWDEALDTVATEIKQIVDNYGAEGIWVHTYSGQVGAFHTGPLTIRRLMKHLGPYTSCWGEASAQAAAFASKATYGTLVTGHTRDDWQNSRLIILWGVNPAESIYSTNTCHYLSLAKQAGARIVLVDPRFTDTGGTLADQWIPIRPGTDAAMLIAMAWVMITEGLHDAGFLERYTAGFDKFQEYVLGRDDGLAKTPQWAEGHTGVPADTIANLAREYATIKPAALFPGYAAGRTAFGEQFHRATATLAAMTGNIGIHGGGPAAFERGPVGPMFPTSMARPKTTYQDRLRDLDTLSRLQKHPHACMIWDAILKGKEGGDPSNIRMGYVAFANPLNQFPNINKGVQALNKLDFLVVHDQFLTATARFADIVLPVTTLWERKDFARPWQSGPYFLYLNKVIKPRGEAKSDMDICRELAPRLGIVDPFFDIDEEEGILQMIKAMGDVENEVPNFEVFRKQGVHKIKVTTPQIVFQDQITDPDVNPFPTPSGRIEIHCQLLADLNKADMPAIPKYIEPWEGPQDTLAQQYPLQLVTIHHRTRAHSCFENNPWLKESDPQRLWINTADARARNIDDSTKVRVYNSRGETVVRARVTERIMPGVVSLGEGAWYQPDDKGRDQAGSPNVLTLDRYTPSGAFPLNTNLVQVEAFNGK